MKPRTIAREEPPTSAIPEDVAALYAWIDLPDATYQDFSAARRASRSRLASGSLPGTDILEPAPAERPSPLGLPQPEPHWRVAATPATLTATPPLFVPVTQPPTPPLSAASSSWSMLQAQSVDTQAPPAQPLWPRFAETSQTEFFHDAPGIAAIEIPEEDPSLSPEPDGSSLEVSPDHPRAVLSLPGPSRWVSLDAPLLSSAAGPVASAPEEHLSVPITAIFALTGGSGKTCLLATLGRILASLGERVVLAETNPQGPLPLYFAAEDFQAEPEESPSTIGDTPVRLASYDLDAAAGDPEREARLFANLTEGCTGASRLLIDLSERAGWFLRRLASPSLTVLIPVSPNMSSVITLQAVERFFRDFADREGRPILPHYLINQFDEEMTVHRDVRDFLERRIGDRLLPFVIRNSPGVRQAFARGMTVVDFAPHSPVSEDYRAVVDWLRTVSPLVPSARPASRSPRWGSK